MEYSPSVPAERLRPVPNPVRPQDLRLRKRRILVGVGVGVAGNAALALAVVALMAVARLAESTAPDEAVALTLTALFAVANLGAIVLLARSGRREWALGVALADVVLVAGSAGFVWWVLANIRC